MSDRVCCTPFLLLIAADFPCPPEVPQFYVLRLLLWKAGKNRGSYSVGPSGTKADDLSVLYLTLWPRDAVKYLLLLYQVAKHLKPRALFRVLPKKLRPVPNARNENQKQALSLGLRVLYANYYIVCWRFTLRAMPPCEYGLRYQRGD